MTCGIYALVFEGTDKLYIGQSINIEIRFAVHKRNLTDGEASIKLNKAYNTYGLPSITILTKCSKENLEAWEVYWITEFDSIANGFNAILGSPSLGVQRNTGRSKYTVQDYLKALELYLDLDVSMMDIACLTRVSKRTLQRVIGGFSHVELLAEYPELLAKARYTRDLRRHQNISKAQIGRSHNADGTFCKSNISV